MASFRYKAVNEAGSVVVGTLVADSEADARARLREMRLFPERLERGGRPLGRLVDRLPGARLKAATQVTVFTRQLAVLLGAGVPLVDALDVLARQTEHRRLAEALSEIREAVNAGASFAGTLAEYPLFFDRAYVGMVASGERTGTLDMVLERLAEFLERRRVLRTRISTAFIYPTILVAAVLGLVGFLSGYVVPRISPLLRQQGRPLPLSSAVLFWAGDLVQAYGWMAILGGACVLLVAPWVRRSARGGALLDRLILRAPLFGPIVRKGLLSRFAMTLSALLRTGVPAAEALGTLAELAPNTVLASEVSRIHAGVLQGKEISGQMLSSRLFPPMMSYMVAVGERSGTLAEVLEHVSRAYDLEVEVACRRMLAVLEPVLVLAMAAVVGFVALSLMMALLELSHI